MVGFVVVVLLVIQAVREAERELLGR